MWHHLVRVLFGLIYSSQFSFILKCAVPGIVASLSATPVNSTALTLRWQPPPPEDRNGVITQYVVNITGLSVARQEPFVLHTTETSIVVGLLHPLYTYACEAAAVTSVGQGPYRSITSQLPEDGKHIYFAIYVVTEYEYLSIKFCSAAPSSAPQHLDVVPKNSTTLHLLWTPPPRETQNGLIIGYRINITELDTGRVLNMASSITLASRQDLHPFYNYSCSVAAYTIVGTGPSVETTVHMPEDGE